MAKCTEEPHNHDATQAPSSTGEPATSSTASPAAPSPFAQEQEHLSQTYARIVDIGRRTANHLRTLAADAAADKESMAGELSANFATIDDASEMWAEFASINRLIDSYNLQHDAATEKLRAVGLLLEQPYFAKIVVRRSKTSEPREVYLGVAGLADDDCRRLVVDWRSPIAEVYYNQSNGLTSYKVDGRTVETELLLRRQFEVERDRLLACFDTTVAIEDPLLLASLSHERGAHMKAITATIQREQNVAVRHEDVPCLVVEGIAGSGKTSVMMQRIAYLLFQNRGSLEPEDVYLISPNPLFRHYIADVLPDLGETNPHIITWREFAKGLLPSGRGVGGKPGDPEALKRIERAAAHYAFKHNDFKDVAVGDTRMISAESIAKIAAKHAHLDTTSHQVTLVREALFGRLEGRLKQLASREEVQIEIAELSYEEQLDVFGEAFDPQTEEEERQGAQRYLRRKLADAWRQVEQDDWLRIDRIGAALLGTHGVSPLEWIYTKVCICGFSNPEARYVMIDEMQDYSEAQLMVLTRYFRRAHFLLLGDPNQAVRQNATPFRKLMDVLERRFGDVTSCPLMTSYRSSAQITAVFATLAQQSRHLQMQIASVREGDHAPQLLRADDAQEARNLLAQTLQEVRKRPGLTAVVVPRKDDVAAMEQFASEVLGTDGFVVLDEDGRLPEDGVVLAPLMLAKGLEFDFVVVPDVSEKAFPSRSDLARRRLYTTVSRATDGLTMVSVGPVTRWLDGFDGTTAQQPTTRR